MGTVADCPEVVSLFLVSGQTTEGERERGREGERERRSQQAPVPKSYPNAVRPMVSSVASLSTRKMLQGSGSWEDEEEEGGGEEGGGAGERRACTSNSR